MIHIEGGVIPIMLRGNEKTCSYRYLQGNTALDCGLAANREHG